MLMGDYPTDIHGPADQARTVTHLYAKCQVCGITWAIRSPTGADEKGCSFCDAPEDAITIISEHPDYSGRLVR